MAKKPSRRTFMKQSATALVALNPPTAPPVVGRHFVCITCGTQFAPTEQPPARCPICEDERQYVGWDGQRWTTLEQMQGSYRNTIHEEEAGLYSIHTEPRFGIGERAFLVQTAQGNFLWDCVTLLDPATLKKIRQLGGIAALAVSHPHYYASMIEWSHAFDGVPVYLHQDDAKWVMRPDPVVTHWSGPTKKLPGGLTLVHTGGHFAGFQVLHWPAGAAGMGALLSGDQPQVCMDRRWVTFMYSYPNSIPLGAGAIRRIVGSLAPFAFDRVYGAFPNLTVTRGGKQAVERSAERYLRAISS